MTRSRKSKVKLTAALALAAILCLNMVLPAFAADAIKGTEENPAEAAITKALVMGEGITTPGLTFHFDFLPVSVDEVPANQAYVPAVDSMSVTFAGADTGETNDGIKTVRKQAIMPFDGVNWPHGGVYVYTLSERQTTPTVTELEHLEFSQAVYRITVYVANGEHGLYVAAIGVHVEASDGQPGVEQDDKVDGRPGVDPEVNGDWSDVVFTNIFSRTTGDGDPDNATLTIGKMVASHQDDAFDSANRQMYFDFEVLVTKSGVNPNAQQKYTAYVMNEKDGVITSEVHSNGPFGTHDEHGRYIEFTTGEVKTIHLKHGEWLAFVDLEVGATYTVKELAREHFTPHYVQTINGAPRTMPGALNTDLATPVTAITEGLDGVEFINVFRQVTPVGIFVDNLPFAILIGLGLAGFVLLVLLKPRRREEDENIRINNV